jgi:hypothetical protein
LFVSLAETSTKLENDEEELVEDERPLAAPSIGGNSECDGADRSQHQHKGNSPCDVGNALIKCFGKLRGSKRNSEKVKGIP